MRRRTRQKPKRITKQQISGQQGVNFVERIVLEMGFTWHPTNAGLEAGIDGIIEVRDADTGDVTNNIIQVQVKAREHWRVCEDTATEFTYLCTERDIDYWMQSNTPVVLVAVRPRGDEAYWADVKASFADAKRRRERYLHFDKKTQRFDAGATSALVKLAVPRDVGPYVPATPRTETLVSNLLEVKSFPERIYTAATDYREIQEIFDWESKNDVHLPRGWLLTEKSIRSVYDLREEPWIDLVDRGTVECFDLAEWADAEDLDVQREFVRLMYQVLREDMSVRGLWHSSDANCFYFPAGRNAEGELFPRQYDYTALQNRTSRQVAMIRRHPETQEIVYCRHNALQGALLKLEGQWYLTITPHYVFTADGKKAYKYGEELLSGIKRLERQEAVCGQVVMWAYKLTHSRPKGLFDKRDRPDPLIAFGTLVQLECDRAVDDEVWLRTDELLTDGDGADASNEWGLFQW